MNVLCRNIRKNVKSSFRSPAVTCAVVRFGLKSQETQAQYIMLNNNLSNGYLFHAYWSGFTNEIKSNRYILSEVLVFFFFANLTCVVRGKRQLRRLIQFKIYRSFYIILYDIKHMCMKRIAGIVP